MSDVSYPEQTRMRDEVTRRRSAAYFFAAGAHHERCSNWRAVQDAAGVARSAQATPLDLSDEFADWYRQKAIEMYVDQTSFHLQSVPDAWDTFVKERAVVSA